MDSVEGKKGKIQSSLYISISLLVILWQIAFTKKGAIILYILHALLQGDFATFTWSGFMSSLESDGPVKNLEWRKGSVSSSFSTGTLMLEARAAV